MMGCGVQGRPRLSVFHQKTYIIVIDNEGGECVFLSQV